MSEIAMDSGEDIQLVIAQSSQSTQPSQTEHKPTGSADKTEDSMETPDWNPEIAQDMETAPRFPFGIRYEIQQTYQQRTPAASFKTLTAEQQAYGPVGDKKSRVRWHLLDKAPPMPEVSDLARKPAIHFGYLSHRFPREAVSAYQSDSWSDNGAPVFARMSPNYPWVYPRIELVDYEGTPISYHDVERLQVDEEDRKAVEIEFHRNLGRMLYNEIVQMALFDLTELAIFFQRCVIFLTWFPPEADYIKGCGSREEAVKSLEKAARQPEGSFTQDPIGSILTIAVKQCDKILHEVDEHNRSLGEFMNDKEWYLQQPYLEYDLQYPVEEKFLFKSSLDKAAMKEAWSPFDEDKKKATTAEKTETDVQKEQTTYDPKNDMQKMNEISGRHSTKASRDVMLACARLGWSRAKLCAARPTLMSRMKGLYWECCDRYVENGSTADVGKMIVGVKRKSEESA